MIASKPTHNATLNIDIGDLQEYLGSRHNLEPKSPKSYDSYIIDTMPYNSIELILDNLGDYSIHKLKVYNRTIKASSITCKEFKKLLTVVKSNKKKDIQVMLDEIVARERIK